MSEKEKKKGVKLLRGVSQQHAKESFEIQEKSRIPLILCSVVLLTVPVVMVTDCLDHSMTEVFAEGVFLLAIGACLAAILRGHYRISANIFVTMVFILNLTRGYMAMVSFYMIAPVILSALVGYRPVHTLLTGLAGLGVISFVYITRFLPAAGVAGSGSAASGGGSAAGEIVSNGVIFLILCVVAFLILRINGRTVRKAAEHSARQEELAGKLQEVAQAVRTRL